MAFKGILVFGIILICYINTVHLNYIPPRETSSESWEGSTSTTWSDESSSGSTEGCQDSRAGNENEGSENMEEEEEQDSGAGDDDEVIRENDRRGNRITIGDLRNNLDNSVSAQDSSDVNNIGQITNSRRIIEAIA